MLLCYLANLHFQIYDGYFCVLLSGCCNLNELGQSILIFVQSILLEWLSILIMYLLIVPLLIFVTP